MLNIFDQIFKFIFFAFSISTMWILTVVCGLFIFTFIPATAAALELSSQYVNNEYSFTDSIVKNYFSEFAGKFKPNLKFIFLPILFIILNLNIHIVKIYSVLGLQLLFIIIYYYLLIFFTAYLAYFCLYLNKKNVSLKADLANGFVFMFSNFKWFILSMLLSVVYLFIFYSFPILGIIFGTGIFVYLFALINLKQLEKLLKK